MVEIPAEPDELFHVTYQQRDPQQVGVITRVFESRAGFEQFARYADATQYVPGDTAIIILRILRVSVPVWESMRFAVFGVMDLGPHPIPENLPEEPLAVTQVTDRMAEGADQPPPHPGGSDA